MPSYDPTRLRLLSEIGKWIPRNWKVRLQYIGSGTNLNAVLPRRNNNVCKSSDKLRLASLVSSLRDFTAKGQISEAFAIFAHIRLEVVSNPNSSSCQVIVLPISSLLEACADDSRFLSQGRQLHGQAICFGVERYPYLVRRLVTFYSAFNLIFDAHCVAESSNSKNPLLWNVVISAYARNGFFSEALSVYRKMLDSGIKPDNFTFPTVLKACGEQLNLDFGREIHRMIDASNRKFSVYVQNALISMYGKCGEVEEARQLFDKSPERDAVSWNSIVAIYAFKGMWDEARDLFNRMLSEVSEVSIVMCNTIAGGYLQVGNFEEALNLLSKMRADFIRVDDVGTVIGLTACSHVLDVNLGQQFHASSIRNGCDEYHNVKNALISMYSRCNDLKHAYTIFQLMENRNLVTWNAIISGYSYWDRLDEASFLFREMLLSGFEPNYVTIASILPLCGRVANLQHGREFHCNVIRREHLNGYLVLWNSIIDMYSRSGKILEARRVFNSLSQKDEVTYTSLIAGYGAQGQGEVAIELFSEMSQFGIKPDHVTILAVLSACSNTGLVNQGQFLFDKMESEYGISPGVEHFGCMVDLFGRAGLLFKAVEIIEKMHNPTPEMLVTLIRACRNHGDMELGEWVAGILLGMRPSNTGSGCWNKVASVETLMRDLGVRKNPGHAWVELGSGFRPFCVGDASDELVGEIYLLLDRMTEQMKDALYGSTEDFLMDGEILEERTSVEEDSVDVKIWHSMVR